MEEVEALLQLSADLLVVMDMACAARRHSRGKTNLCSVSIQREIVDE